jgi:hypothetical protein
MDRPTGVNSLASAISRSDPLDFFLAGFVKDSVYVPPLPITLNNLKAEYKQRLQKPISLLQNVWREVECRLDVFGANKWSTQ